MTIKKTSLDKSLIKIVLLEKISQQAVDYFKKAGYSNIVSYDEAFDKDELISKISDAHIIGVRSRTLITKEVIDHCPKLIAVGCFCVGTNQVDLSYAAEKGIVVFNAPYSNTRSVAELVICYIIMLMRNIANANSKCHQGIWDKSSSGSYEVRGKTLGIIGYGAIGRQVSILAEAIGMNVIFYDQMSQLTFGNAEAAFSLEDLCNKSDVITLHIPESGNNKGFVNKDLLKSFKKGALLINASRGKIINVDDLVDALKSGHIAGAALDVFPVEPKDITEEFVSPFRDFDNVILTPHIGGSTVEAQNNIGSEVAEKLTNYSDVGTTLQSVNFPEVNLPKNLNQDTHRILHIHHYQPGIMNQLNKVFADLGINVNGQYLQSNDKVGYVVVDFVKSNVDVKQLQQQIKAIPGTLRTRILY